MTTLGGRLRLKQRLPKLAQCALAFVVWLAFMTGLRLFATRAG